MQHAVRLQGALLAFVLLAEFAVVSWCTFWPLWGVLHDLSHFKGWLGLYSFPTSTLDVWVLMVCRALVTVGLVLGVHTRTRRRYGAPQQSNQKQVLQGLSIMDPLYQLFLLAKAVAAAIAAPEVLLPPRPPNGNAGLLCYFLAVGATFVACAAAGVLARSLVEERGYSSSGDEELGEAAVPLLGSGASSKDASVHGSSTAGGSKGVGKGQEAADEQKKASVNQRTVRELLRMSTPDTPLLLVAFAAGCCAALAQGAVPYYTGLIIDYASIDPDRHAFHQTTLKLLGVALLCGLFTGLRGGLFTVAMTRLNVRIRTALFASLLRQDIGFYDTNRTGEITSRLAADTTTVADQVSLNLNVLVRSLTQASVVLAFMFGSSWRLTVVTFILIPFVMLISKVYGAYYRKLSKKVQAELAEANGVAEEVLSSMTTVRAHAAEDSAAASYADKLHAFYMLQQKEALAYAAYATSNTFLPTTVAAVVLYYGGSLVLSGEMSPGALVSFMLYQTSLAGAFSMMGDVFSALTAAIGAADKVVELINRRPATPATGSLAPPTFAGQLDLTNVTFAYPARPNISVLSGLTLSVSPGEVVALVGPSGGGKSSIIKLLQRFYVPVSGLVAYDGVDVGQYDPKWLRRHVALVSQEPVLYARTIRRNIIYGLEKTDGAAAEPSQEEIEAAARQANAHDFITAFPDGYETSCGDKGLAISGGQKQRIAIARALVRKPAVLLLDEATSALDADSEAVVQEALERVMLGRTVLVIAHRLSTVQGADRIIVVNKGAVQEVGTHEELLAQRGFYSQLVQRQLTKASSSASLFTMSRPHSFSAISGASAAGATSVADSFANSVGESAGESVAGSDAEARDRSPRATSSTYGAAGSSMAGDGIAGISIGVPGITGSMSAAGAASIAAVAGSTSGISRPTSLSSLTSSIRDGDGSGHGPTDRGGSSTSYSMSPPGDVLNSRSGMRAPGSSSSPRGRAGSVLQGGGSSGGSSRSRSRSPSMVRRVGMPGGGSPRLSEDMPVPPLPPQ